MCNAVIRSEILLCNAVKLSKFNTLTAVDGFSYRHELHLTKQNYEQIQFYMAFRRRQIHNFQHDYKCIYIRKLQMQK